MRKFSPTPAIIVKSIFTFLFIFCFSFIDAQAQNKYSEQINAIKDSYDQEKLRVLYTEFSERQLRLKKEAEEYAILNNIPIRYEKEDGTLLELQYLTEEGIPIYYTTFNANAAISTRANYLNTGGGLGLDLNGDGLTAHVWDGGLARSTHQEYDGLGGNNRFSIGDGTTTLHYHSAHVTGTIIASGVQPAAKGMAWQANAVGYDWNSDVSEASTAASNGMLISNHSYGYIALNIPDSWFGQYGSDAVDWDNLMYTAPNYLMLVAAGNEGNDNSSNGSPLDGNIFYDKLSGHSTAKNNLVVANGQDATINGDGSLNSVIINSGSSEGPTDDYRIKPDITGNGTGLYSTYESSDSAYNSISGTSMASPNVAGSLLLLQEHYNNLNSSFMKAATLKGLALHTADDAGPTGPDAVYGWGLLNTKKAAETITTDAASSGSAIIDELVLSQGQTYEITVQSNGVDPLMASISWTDPAGTLNSGTNSSTPALVNDLDIRLDNGSTFTPWRLTSITTNGTGDNLVDPYERIDISGASGTYTLTVTHKGTLSSGPQNFSLIVTGIVVATTPVISYSITSATTTEDTNCFYTDLNIPLNIALAPSANADVSFAINGSSTATSGLDFDLMTSNVTFPTASLDPKNMILRVYHDGFVESDETVMIDFTVNANGGDATANLNADSFILTINDNDTATLATQIISIYDEDFDDGVYDVTTSGNTGSDLWSAGNTAGASSTYWDTSGNNTSFFYTNDDACNCDKANDLLTTTVFSLDGSYTSATLTFDHAFSDIGAELGDVLISTGGAFTSVLSLSNTSIDNGGVNYTTPWVNGVTIDLTPYIGQATVRVQFRYNDGNAWAYGMAVDNILVTGVSPTLIQTAINTGISNDQQTLATTGTIYTSDSASSNVMLNITNNQADNYGCLDVSVSRAGTGALPYDGSTFPNLVMYKTFDLNPENTVYAGDVSITFYFSKAEIDGWVAATGLTRSDLIAGREFDGTIIETSTLVEGSFGTDDVTFTGTFTGLDDTFVFGPSGVSAFSTCNGLIIWDGSNWLNEVSPNNSFAVLITENYNTASNGNIDGCKILIRNNKTLTIGAGEYLKTEDEIKVIGTLNVLHEGSVVQINADAKVINNGTITVEKITPVLADTDFTILGSPMTGETRQGVYGAAVNVRDYHTLSFNPDPGVEAVSPLADNWADEEGDDWQVYSNGPLALGEGYLVKPVANGGTGAAFTTNYTQGTLNNGTITFNALFNTTRNDSPNMLSNPYASAIDVAAFIGDNGTLGGAVYFWEHQTAPNIAYPGYYTQNYHMGDISYRNASMGMAADNGGGIPSNFIASGQGFGIKPTVAGPITFSNTHRVTGPNDDYRMSDISIDKLYIKLINERYELKSTTGIGFSEVATDGFDQDHDTKRLATPISIYSLNSEREFGLQGRSVFNVDHVIPLGFSTQVEENQNYTISISSIEGDLISTATVHLIDNLLETSTNLLEEDYVFSSNVGSQTDRFVIVFTEETLGSDELLSESISMYPNPTKNLLHIVSPQASIKTIAVYDIRGRVVHSIEVENQYKQELDITDLETAMYFVRISTQLGSITKRIIKE